MCSKTDTNLTSEALAHSARKNAAAQSYEAHTKRVTRLATRNAVRAARFYKGDCRFFVETVRAAAFYHDLGKLDEQNQRVLISSPTEPLPLNHVDAGAAHLLRLNRLESSVLAFAHHIGLPDYFKQGSNKELAFRDERIFEHTNSQLDDYLSQHGRILRSAFEAVTPTNAKWTGLTRRLALSCLVDADHTDTAEHYGNELPQAPPKLRAAERLKSLDDFVSGLSEGESEKTLRNEIRQKVYLTCRDAQTDPAMWACDSPVGTGKTTAIMAHLLQAAVAKKLRRIFVVLPYTNIIKQSVNTYSKALVLAGEDPEAVVAAHHHQADFSSREFRHLAQLWNAPIVVTTAVQFFETLGSHRPSRLRKLHELAGSAILIDESHAAIPSWLWPQVWLWLDELVRNWGCHIVFASGSLVRFWQLDDFLDTPVSLPELVSEQVRAEALDFEIDRVSYCTLQSPLNLDELVPFVLEKRGPRLLILNTVQSAAVVADRLAKRRGREKVFHLSTALCPADRDAIVQQINARLKQRGDTDWTLVATSCVEAGMDFSFRTAFRERCGLVNLIQIGGRINRSGEYETAEVWDFITSDPMLSQHPAFIVSQNILREMFEENEIGLSSSTEAIRREVQCDPIKKCSNELKEKERKMNYPEVAKLCRVIDSDTQTVLIKQDIISALEQHEPVQYADIIKHSVQIWSKKLEMLPVRPVHGNKDLWAWTGAYDTDFLGYMAGAIPLIEAQKSSLMIL